jgi:hypothetical protein
MAPTSWKKTQAIRQKVADLNFQESNDSATEAESTKVQLAPSWSHLSNSILADVVGFTDPSERTSCASSELAHYGLRTLESVYLHNLRKRRERSTDITASIVKVTKRLEQQYRSLVEKIAALEPEVHRLGQCYRMRIAFFIPLQQTLSVQPGETCQWRKIS